MNSFYVPSLTVDAKQVILSEEESKHACRVLRLKNGDKVALLDGKGGTYLAEIADDHPKRCQLQIQSVEITEKQTKSIHIAVAPTKNMDRMEWFLEKATELGVTEVTFLVCQNSERKALKLDRLEKIIVSAMKQSKRTYLPILHDLISIKDFLVIYPKGAVAHCFSEEKKSLQSIFEIANFPILIGPEGDFSLEEIRLLQESGYQAITLGENRLRTETAALFACMQAVMV